MAGKVLTEEDFTKSGDPTKDTPPDTIPADQKFDQDGKPVVEEPKKEEPAPKETKGDEEPLPKPSDFKPKHKTWEETEKARVELEKNWTRDRMALSDRDRELAQYKKPAEKPAPTIDDHIAEITDEALTQINVLPLEYDSEGKVVPASASKRDRDAAIIWGKAQRKISRLEIDESNKRSQAEHDTVSKTYERATKEGLKTDAELRILGHEFSRTDPNMDLDTRIDRAIESTKGILSQVREGFIERQEKDKHEKDDLKVMGRGSSRPTKKEEKEDKPTTMSEQLTNMNESRRLKKDDLWR